jgi:hypothetical protein
MTSRHRPHNVHITEEGAQFGISIGLQNASMAGELTPTSTAPHVQPKLD